MPLELTLDEKAAIIAIRESRKCVTSSDDFVILSRQQLAELIGRRPQSGEAPLPARGEALFAALKQALASHGHAIVPQDLPDDLARAIASVVRVGLTMNDATGQPKPFSIPLAIARDIVFALRREALVGTASPTAKRGYENIPVPRQ
jgi:hypothetical protein